MKKGMAMLLAAVVLLTVSAGAVDVTAEAALLMEKETGEILFAKHEHEQMEPASITKVMTALLTLEAIEAGQITEATLFPVSLFSLSYTTLPENS